MEGISGPRGEANGVEALKAEVLRVEQDGVLCVDGKDIGPSSHSIGFAVKVLIGLRHGLKQKVRA